MTYEAVAEGEEHMASLLHRAGRGETAAFDDLYRSCSPWMFRTSLRLLKSPELAEDVVQDTLMKVWQRAASYSPERGAPKAWLSAIVRNRALDVIRHRKPIEISLDDEELPRVEPADRSMDVPAWTDMNMVMVGVAKELEAMPAQMRACIVMSCYEGYTNTEIAERLRTPLGTVKCWIRRGLIRLRAASTAEAAPLFAS